MENQDMPTNQQANTNTSGDNLIHPGSSPGAYQPVSQPVELVSQTPPVPQQPMDSTPQAPQAPQVPQPEQPLAQPDVAPAPGLPIQSPAPAVAEPTPAPTDETLPQSHAAIAAAPAKSKKQRKKRNTKKLLLIMLAVLLIAGGAVLTYIFLFMKSEPAPQPVAVNQSAEQAYTHRFYISDAKGTLTLYDPVGKRSEIIKLDLSEDRLLHGGSLGQNQPVVFSGDGKTVLYATATPKPGDGLMELESTTLSVFADGKEIKLKTYAVADGQTIADWQLSGDAKTVYYLVAGEKSDTGDPAMLSLYSIPSAGGEEKLIKENIAKGTSDGGAEASLLRDNSGSIVYYATDEDGVLVEYKITDEQYTSRRVGKVDCAGIASCSLETPKPLSPDGKQLLLESIKDGQMGSFGYHLLDLATAKTTSLYEPPVATEQLTWSFWSPDSRQIVADVSSFGDPKPDFRQRITLISIADGKATALVTAKDSATTLTVLGWSPDGRFLAFSENDKLKLYEFSSKEIVDMDLETLFDTSSDRSFGWY